MEPHMETIPRERSPSPAAIHRQVGERAMLCFSRVRAYTWFLATDRKMRNNNGVDAEPWISL